MSDKGYKVYRYKGWYFVYYYQYDSYPEGLGLWILRAIPTDSKKFVVWLRDWKLTLEEELSAKGLLNVDANGYGNNGEEYYGNESNYFITRDKPRPYYVFDYTFELDFDNMIFHVNGVPIFKLDHMPSEDIFLDCIGYDLYGHRAPCYHTPHEHVYTLPIKGPSVPAEVDLHLYASCVGSEGSVGIDELLGVVLTNRDEIRVVVLQAIVGLYMRSSRGSIVNPWLTTFVDRMDIPVEALRATHDLIRFSVSHHIFGASNRHNTPVLDLLDLVWLRADMFLWIATELHSEKHLKAAIANVIYKLQEQSKQGVLFGIICSLAHVVILRIDRSSSDVVVKHTSALQFLPSVYSDSPTTPGITALARLAGQADCNFIVNSQNGLRACPVSTFEDAIPQRFPAEIWLLISEQLYDSKDLISFGCVTRLCRVVAAESLRDLYLPGIRPVNKVDVNWTKVDQRVVLNSATGTLDPFAYVLSHLTKREEEPEPYRANPWLFYATFQAIDDRGLQIIHLADIEDLDPLHKYMTCSNTFEASGLSPLRPFAEEPVRTSLDTDWYPVFFSHPVGAVLTCKAEME